jgi:hypothetical protein
MKYETFVMIAQTEPRTLYLEDDDLGVELELKDASSIKVQQGKTVIVWDDDGIEAIVFPDKNGEADYELHKLLVMTVAAL